MDGFSLDDSDRERIAHAVERAEAASDGEIVTIIARRSDAYHDVGLHYALAGMLLFLALVAAFPADFSAMIETWLGGWNHKVPVSVQLTLLLGAQIALFLTLRYALAWMPLRLFLTPEATRARRVRRQAVTLFRTCAQGRTRADTAILLYLSLAEHRAEIVADATISARVAPERWGAAMERLLLCVRDGRPGDGMVEAVEGIGAILAEQVPKSPGNPNELPNRLIQI